MPLTEQEGLDRLGSADAVRAAVAPFALRLRHLTAAVGVVDGERTTLAAFGPGAAGRDAGDLVFEIGSITKVFTGLLLAGLVTAGRVALDDPIRPYLPREAAGGPDGAGAIPFRALATHTSGLPRLPGNLVLTRRTMPNPYAAYTEADLYACLAAFRRADSGPAPMVYSNLGAGLLGNLVGQILGLDYEEAVRTRIADPLGLADTGIRLTTAQRERLVPGHSARGREVPNWDLPALAGAGGLRSTVRDLTALLRAAMQPDKGPLGPALALSLEPQANAPDGVSMGLGWVLSRLAVRPVVWHNGATGGYNAYMGFLPGRRLGVVVLTNYTVPSTGGRKPQADAIGTAVLQALA